MGVPSPEAFAPGAGASYSHFVQREPSAARRRAQVYYSLLALFAFLGGGRAEGQVGLTVVPAMTRGAASAPVTIVEFSDYQ